MPVTEHTSSRPGFQKQFGGAQRGERAPQGGRGVERVLHTVAKASTATVRSGVRGTSRSRAAVTTAKVPSLPQNRLGQVVAGVVLDQAPEVGNHRPGSEHGLHADDLCPGAPVAQDVRTTGVGADGPSDRRRVSAGQVDARTTNRQPPQLMHGARSDAGPCGDLPGKCVDRLDRPAAAGG